MKFLFCGGQSVPEWFLSQLNLVSNLSFIKLRKIANLYVVALSDSEQKASSVDQIMEIIGGGDLSHNECQTIVAIVDFILGNAAKNNVESETLLKELIDLGIPKENCQSICKIYEANLEKLRQAFMQKTLRLNAFDSISVKKWNYLLLSEGKKKNLENQDFFKVDINLSNNKLTDQSDRISFCTDKGQLTRFTEEMSTILKILNNSKKQAS